MFKGLQGTTREESDFSSPQTELFFHPELECQPQNSGLGAFSPPRLEEQMQWLGGTSQARSVVPHGGGPVGPCPRRCSQVGAEQAEAFRSQAASGPVPVTEQMRGAVRLLAASCLPPITWRLLKFGVRWPASPLRNYHAIKEFFLEICVPMGSN